MNAPILSAASPQEALAAAAALPLVLYGYPLVESLRTCRLQTSAREATGYGRAPVNVLSASERQWTHEDRDIVTPANDLLYFCGWIHGRRAGHAAHPAAARARALLRDRAAGRLHAQFRQPGPRNIPPEGGEVVLAGPAGRPAARMW